MRRPGRPRRVLVEMRNTVIALGNGAVSEGDMRLFNRYYNPFTPFEWISPRAPRSSLFF